MSTKVDGYCSCAPIGDGTASFARDCGIAAHRRAAHPGGKPDAVALANVLWDINWELISWADCYKSAEAIVAAGWHR